MHQFNGKGEVRVHDITMRSWLDDADQDGRVAAVIHPHHIAGPFDVTTLPQAALLHGWPAETRYGARLALAQLPVVSGWLGGRNCLDSSSSWLSETSTGVPDPAGKRQN